MKVDANVSLGAICRAMGRPEFQGAIIKDVRVTVSYRSEGTIGVATFVRQGGDRLTVGQAEVLAADAVDAMNDDERASLDFESGDALPDVNDADLHDFIACCLAGDRTSALALVPRLFNPGNADTAEQLLLVPARRIA